MVLTVITKRNGHGQTECVGCKNKGKFTLTWDSFLYTFNGEPYCLECLLEMLDKKEVQQKEFILYLRNLSNWYSADGVKQGMVNEILQKYKEIIGVENDRD